MSHDQNRYKPSLKSDSLVERLQWLLEQLGDAEGPISIAGLGRIIGKDVGRPIGRSVATRWFSEEKPLVPDAFEIVAIARRAGVSVEEFMADLTPPVKRRNKPKRVSRLKNVEQDIRYGPRAPKKPARKTAG